MNSVYMMMKGLVVSASFVLGLWWQASVSADYERGRQALDQGRWQEAIEAFASIPDEDPAADAALYWQAYAYQKLGEALRTLDLVAALEERFPESEWRDDARALAVEARGGRRRSAAADDDEELKLMALNALMHSDEEEAIPILREFLEGDQSTRLKERALFVLAQSGSDQGFEVVAEVARDSSAPDLQRKALRYMGVHSSARSLQLLSELYGSLTDAESRGVILQSFMVAGEQERLLELARSEPDEDLRGRAIRLLGTMDASDELWELYQNEASTEVRGRILQAFMISGDTERLVTVARNESEPEELRSRAIRLLGTQDAVEELQSLYETTTSVELRKRILHGLFISGAVEPLSAIARDEASPLEIRESAIHNLGLTGDSSRATLLDIYASATTPTDLKERVLHSLFLQQAASELIELSRAETDLELKKKAIHWLSLLDDSPEAKAYLMEILRR